MSVCHYSSNDYIALINLHGKKFKVLKVCAEKLFTILNGCVSLPMLEKVEIVKECDYGISIHKTFDPHWLQKFPLLTSIIYQGDGKNVFKGNEPDCVVANAKIFYQLCENRDKIECAKTLFWCIRKTYSGLDKNVVKKICREYVSLPYQLLCKEEKELRDNHWIPGVLKKRRIQLQSKLDKVIRTQTIMRNEKEKLYDRIDKLNKKIDACDDSFKNIITELEQKKKMQEFINQ